MPQRGAATASSITAYGGMAALGRRQIILHIARIARARRLAPLLRMLTHRHRALRAARAWRSLRASRETLGAYRGIFNQSSGGMAQSAAK